MKLVACGRRWEIRLDENKWIAIKKAKDKSKIPAINKERQILLKLKENGIKFVPQIIDWWDWRFSYRRIPWITMYDILKILNNHRQSKNLSQTIWKIITDNKKQLNKTSSQCFNNSLQTSSNPLPTSTTLYNKSSDHSLFSSSDNHLYPVRSNLSNRVIKSSDIYLLFKKYLFLNLLKKPTYLINFESFIENS